MLPDLHRVAGGFCTAPIRHPHSRGRGTPLLLPCVYGGRGQHVHEVPSTWVHSLVLYPVLPEHHLARLQKVTHSRAAFRSLSLFVCVPPCFSLLTCTTHTGTISTPVCLGARPAQINVSIPAPAYSANAPLTTRSRGSGGSSTRISGTSGTKNKRTACALITMIRMAPGSVLYVGGEYPCSRGV